ncbi:MAG TPA: hypothetical protein VNI60_07425 [Pyrinomonadaceae bacterium]|nr:hypothetical protein [Pyrinomonadaceae bacterium]
MKFITAVVVFSITFGFSTVLAGLFAENNQTGQKISSLLQEDIQNGQEMEEMYRFASSLDYAEAVSEYVANSQAIDDTNLPADFRFAWQAHMAAWRTHANFLNRSDCMRKRMSEEEISQILIAQKYEIMTTWMNVLRIGIKYGAVIPPNAY